jgi:hypothetical protein
MDHPVANRERVRLLTSFPVINVIKAPNRNYIIIPMTKNGYYFETSKNTTKVSMNPIFGNSGIAESTDSVMCGPGRP